jgi:hypothetical protein
VYVLQNTKVHVTKPSLSGGSILSRECAKSYLRASRGLKFFSGGYTPGPPVKKGREDIRRERRGGERKEREGGRKERREENGAPSLQASAHLLPVGWLRPWVEYIAKGGPTP